MEAKEPTTTSAPTIDKTPSPTPNGTSNGAKHNSPRRVSNELREMARKALEEHRAGLTEEFPA